MPVGNSVQTIRPTLFAKRYHHACKLTGASMDELAGKLSDLQYVESWTELNLDGVVDAARKMANIYGYGTGNGRLGTVSTGATSVTQTFSNNDNTRYLRQNMAVQFIEPVAGTVRNATPVTITSDPAPGDTTITLSASVATTTADIIVIAGGFNQAWSGLQHIVDDGTRSSVFFQNVDRTVTPKYNAQLINASSVAISATFLRRLLGGKIFQAMGTLKRGDFEIWSHESQWSQMASQGWSLKRYEGKAKSFDLGFTTIEWEGIPWVTEVDCPKDLMFLMDWSTIEFYENTPWAWDEKTGAIWRQVPSNDTGYEFTDQYTGYYQAIRQYGCPDPRRNGLIYGLPVPTGF